MPAKHRRAQLLLVDPWQGNKTYQESTDMSTNTVSYRQGTQVYEWKKTCCCRRNCEEPNYSLADHCAFFLLLSRVRIGRQRILTNMEQNAAPAHLKHSVQGQERWWCRYHALVCHHPGINYRPVEPTLASDEVYDHPFGVGEHTGRTVAAWLVPAQRCFSRRYGATDRPFLFHLDELCYFTSAACFSPAWHSGRRRAAAHATF
ncbi:hypothetical protein LIA77_02485 [Sarocladium implicatum]|nr:hypothetical protein LIA77_02485 [Sarocladium implicatum]